MPVVRRFLSSISISFPGGVSLVMICLLVVLVQIWLGSITDFQGLVTGELRYYYELLGISWEGISHFRVWQLFGYVLIHAHWPHLLINLVMLWVLGVRVIRFLGQKCFLMIVCLGAVCGGLSHVLTDFMIMRAGYTGTTAVGISGVCFALLLTLTTLSPHSRVWPIPISGKNLGLGVIIAELLLLLMTPALGVPVFSDLGETVVGLGGGDIFIISHACHLGGALAGWLFAKSLLLPDPGLTRFRHAR